MNTWNSIGILLTLNSLFMLPNLAEQKQPSQPTATLEVQINNIKKAKGQIMLAVYNSADDFLSPNYFRTAVEKVAQEGVISVQISDLAFGSYAISVFHDLNSNENLDTNLLGIPSEPYGFSNDARGLFGPPDYEKARFDFEKNGQIIEVKVK